MLKVRLASEEFSALLESRFLKEVASFDLKLSLELSSRNLPLSEPMALSLAIHTARISARISQDDLLLSQHLSCNSSMRISCMMAILLHAAGDPFDCRNKTYSFHLLVAQLDVFY